SHALAVAMLAAVFHSVPINLGTGSAVIGTSVAEAGNRCRKRDDDCNRATSGKSYRGTDTNPNKIQVTVCHGYWHLLDVGTYKGQRTRWWEPVIVKGEWKSTPVKTITSECITMWRRPGEQVAVYADCVKRIIWTPPLYVSGKTYY